MGERIVVQPNGLYAVFSSIVDDFIVTNATADELIQEYVDEAIEKAKRMASEGIKRAHEPRQKYASCHCLEKIHNIHGDAKMQAAKAEINKLICSCGAVSVASCDNCDAWFCEEYVGQRSGDRQVEDVGAVAYPSLCEKCCKP